MPTMACLKDNICNITEITRLPPIADLSLKDAPFTLEFQPTMTEYHSLVPLTIKGTQLQVVHDSNNEGKHCFVMATAVRVTNKADGPWFLSATQVFCFKCPSSIWIHRSG